MKIKNIIKEREEEINILKELKKMYPHLQYLDDCEEEFDVDYSSFYGLKFYTSKVKYEMNSLWMKQDWHCTKLIPFKTITIDNKHIKIYHSRDNFCVRLIDVEHSCFVSNGKEITIYDYRKSFGKLLNDELEKRTKEAILDTIKLYPDYKIIYPAYLKTLMVFK